MNLAEMRTDFAKQVSDLEVGLSDPDIDVYLNRAYQFTVPEELDGAWTEQVWSLQTSASVREYSYADSITGTYGRRAWIESIRVGLGELDVDLSYVDIVTDPLIFEAYERRDTGTGRPLAILAYARKIRLDRLPDLPYFIKIPARGGPTTALTDSGLTHETHAKAVVHAAAFEFLDEVEDEAGAARQQRLTEDKLTRLRRIGHSEPKERDRVRSF